MSARDQAAAQGRGFKQPNKTKGGWAIQAIRWIKPGPIVKPGANL